MKDDDLDEDLADSLAMYQKTLVTFVGFFCFVFWFVLCCFYVVVVVVVIVV